MQGYSLRRLADEVNMSFVALQRLECGKTDPRLSTLRKLAKALDVSVSQLVGEKRVRKSVKPKTPIGEVTFAPISKIEFVRANKVVRKVAKGLLKRPLSGKGSVKRRRR